MNPPQRDLVCHGRIRGTATDVHVRLAGHGHSAEASEVRTFPRRLEAGG
jgi:hypothetical protein